MPEETKNQEQLQKEASEKFNEYFRHIESSVEEFVEDAPSITFDDSDLEERVKNVSEKAAGWRLGGLLAKLKGNANEFLNGCGGIAVRNQRQTADEVRGKAKELGPKDSLGKLKLLFEAMKEYMKLYVLRYKRLIYIPLVKQIIAIDDAVKNNKEDKQKQLDLYNKTLWKIKEDVDEKVKTFEKTIDKELKSVNKTIDTKGISINKLLENLKTAEKNMSEALGKILLFERELKPKEEKIELPNSAPKPSVNDYDDSGFSRSAYMAAAETKRQVMKKIYDDFSKTRSNVVSYKNRYVNSIAVLGDRVQNETKRDCEKFFNDLDQRSDDFEAYYSAYMKPGSEDVFAQIDTDVKDKKESDLVLEEMDRKITECRAIQINYESWFRTYLPDLNANIDALEKAAEAAKKEPEQPPTQPAVEQKGEEPKNTPSNDSGVNQETESQPQVQKVTVVDGLSDLLENIRREPGKAYELLSASPVFTKLKAYEGEDTQVKIIRENLEDLKQYLKDKESSFGARNREAKFDPNIIKGIADVETRRSMVAVVGSLARYYDSQEEGARRIHKDVSRFKPDAYKEEKKIRADLLRKWMKRYTERLENYKARQWGNSDIEDCFVISKQAANPAEAAMLEFRNAMYDARIDLFGLNPKKPGDVTKAWKTLTSKSQIEKKLKEFKKNQWIKGKSEEIIYNLYAILKAYADQEKYNSPECSYQLFKLKQKFNGISGMTLKLSGAIIYPLKTQFCGVVDKIDKFLKLHDCESIDAKDASKLSLEEVLKSVDQRLVR